MKFSAFLAALVLLTACNRTATVPAQPTEMQAQMRTIESVDPRPVVFDPPPVLTDEAPPPKPKALPWETPEPIVFSPEDEKVRASLPFTPAIAMDPIDGSKISIRANTPIVEYKGRLYYFSSEAHKKQFAANPDEYLKGSFSKL